jgi:hypothetical protein
MRFGRRLTAWENSSFDPIRITSQGLLKTNATCGCYSARSRDRILDSVTELEELAVACVEVAVLPLIWANGENSSEIIIMLKCCESKHVLEGVDLIGRTFRQHLIDVINDEGNIGAAVLRHALLNWIEVLPLEIYQPREHLI